MDMRIDALLDDELDARDLAELLAEAEVDPSLRAELDRARYVREAMRSLPEHQCPPEIAARVKAVANRPAMTDRPARTRLRRVYGPAALAVAAAIAFLVVMVPVTPPPASEPTAEEVQQALEEVQLAFAIVADVGRVTGETVRDDVLPRTTDPVRRVVRQFIPDETHQIQ